LAAQAAIHANLQECGAASMDEGREKDPYVYILASKPDGVLYTGVTSQLFERVSIHKQDLYEGYTKKYRVHTLVYYEWHALMDDAIKRESQIKKWKRTWKVKLIETMNPAWTDLFDEQWGYIKDGPADIAQRRD
jgi:putative endonuclease